MLYTLLGRLTWKIGLFLLHRRWRNRRQALRLPALLGLLGAGAVAAGVVAQRRRRNASS